MEINPVKGTKDVYGQEVKNYHKIEMICRYVADLYNYEEIRTPILEHTNLFMRSVGESSDIVSKEMYTFNDKANRSVTLRPEVTAGVMRSIVTNKLYANADLPLKYFYIGPCFRYERPQAGRYRQFHQFGIEALGEPSYHLDAEAIAVGHRILITLGLPKVRVLINSLGDEESRAKYKEALKEYFKPHIDKMCPDCKRRYEVNPLRILDCKVPEDIEIVKKAPKLHDFLSDESRLYLDNVIADLKEVGIEVEIDDNLVRGLDYYTGVVFEYHVYEDETLKDAGALGGGGHYAKLLSEVGGPDLEGIGMALGIERLALVDEVLNSDDVPLGVDFYLMGMSDSIIEQCFSLADILRSEGLSVECAYKAKSLKSMFKAADRKHAKFAIIVGEDEIEKKQIKVKNLKTQEQTDVKLNDMALVLKSMVNEYMEAMFIEHNEVK